MYKVFLSSTSRDLADYREAVHRAIDGLPGFQLIKMEDFGARDANAKDLCARLVQESDLFVGLMGHYYGSCPPDEPSPSPSWSTGPRRMRGLPRLMFAAPDDFPIPASLRESDASFERQQALRREVMSERVVASFDTPEQLASAVTKALFVWHEEQRRAEQPEASAEAERAEPAAVAPEAEKPLGAEPLSRARSVPEGGCRSVLRARGVGRSALERVSRAARGSDRRRGADPAAGDPRRVGLGQVVGRAGGSAGQAGT